MTEHYADDPSSDRFWLLLIGVSALVVAGIWALAVIVRMG